MPLPADYVDNSAPAASAARINAWVTQINDNTAELATRGLPNGLAELGSDGKLKPSQTPAGSGGSGGGAVGIDLDHDFTLEANGAPSAVAQSGQSVRLSYSESTAQATISSGELIDPDTTGGPSAIYWTAPLSDNARIIWARWYFRFFDDGGSTSTEEVCCVLWESNMPNGSIAAASNRSPAHIVVLRNQMFIQSYDSASGGGANRGGPVTFGSLLPQNTVLMLEVQIDTATNQLTLICPDGVTRQYTHADFGTIPAYYVCCECLINAPATDDNVGYRRVQADSVIGGRTSVPLTDPAAVTVPVWMEVHSTYGARAVGYGDNRLGFMAPEAFTLTGVVYRGATADASGSSTVEVRNNGTQITGTSKTITAANQWAYDSDVTVTGLSVAIAAGDIIRPYISAVGTTPGDSFGAVLIGTKALAVTQDA